MATILRKEINKLEKKLLALSAQAEESVHKAVKAVEARDAELAEQVIQSDVEIDRMEVDLEEDVLKILALHQPVAVDLRFIIAVLKINNDLERVGDLATTIAKRARVLSDTTPVEPPFDLRAMAEKAWGMIRRSVDAVVGMDPELARSVRAEDKELDRSHQESCRRIEAGIARNVTLVGAYSAYQAVSRALERVGDHAANIAEDVIYMVEGEIVRHEKSQRAAMPRGETPVR